MAIDAADSGGEVSGSGVEKVVVCHEGKDKSIPEASVYEHLAHGDTFGSCTEPPQACPCFSVPEIQTAAAQCSTTVNSACVHGDLYLGCEAWGTVPARPLGFYSAQTTGGLSCQPGDGPDLLERTGLTDAEYQDCAAAIRYSGYCS